MAPIHALHLPATPLADRFVTGQPRYPLDLVIDPDTWLLSLDQSNAPADEDLFGSDYGFQTSSSPALVRYFADYAWWAHKNFPDEMRRGVVEIGCNDGTLMQHFDHGPFPVVGVDPSRAAANPLHGDMRIHNEPFTSDLANDDLLPEFRDCLVIANNVLAHVADLADTLEGISYLVGDKGAAILEFGYAGDFIATNGFDLLYHEHRRIFSLTSLAKVLQPHGLYPVSVLRTPQQGGSLRVTVRRFAPGGDEPDKSAITLYAQETWLRTLSTYTSLQGRVDYVRNKILSTVLDEYETGRKIALWGAPAKATTLLHATGITPMILFAEDLTPYKHGKVMPGTDIPIVPPGVMKADTYILGSHNYAGRAYRTPGRYIRPIPLPEIVEV